MRNLFTFLFCLFATVLTVKAQTVIFEDDFQDAGFPTSEGYTLHDVDGNTANSTVFKKAWNRLQFTNALGEWFIASTSDYSPAGTADDWVITKQLRLTSSTDNNLFYNVRNASTQKTNETYEVLISTSTADLDSFVVIKAETATPTSWTSEQINLDSYAGQDVYLAFRNTTTAGTLIAIDNIAVVSDLPTNDLSLESVSPIQGELNAYGKVNDVITISGVVKNTGGSTISSYTVYYQEGNNTPVSTQQSTSLAPYTSTTFGNISYTIPSKGIHNLKVWVELSGDNIATNDSAMAYVEGITFNPTKRILFEEATGTWCGWCTRGSYHMKKFSKDYPGKTSQVAVHNNDPMMVASYDQMIRSVPGFTGFPGIAVDRRFTDDPGNIEALYQQHKNDFGFAGVEMKAPTFSGKQVSVSVEIKPAVEISGAKLALIITEDSVTGTGNGWGQVNYYAGGGRGPMGGYEKKPSPINNEVYEFVGRSITPSAGGGTSGLPATMSEGQTYTATLTGTLNAAWNKNNLTYIVALIGKDGSILNSDNSNTSVGLNKEELGLSKAVLYPNPVANDAAFLSVMAENAMEGTITVMDITGRTVNTISNVTVNVGQNTIEVPTSSLTNGIYVVSFQLEKGTLNFKLQVAK